MNLTKSTLPDALPNVMEYINSYKVFTALHKLITNTDHLKSSVFKVNHWTLIGATSFTRRSKKTYLSCRGLDDLLM